MYQRPSSRRTDGTSIGDQITVVAIAAMISFLLTLAIGVAS